MNKINFLMGHKVGITISHILMYIITNETNKQIEFNSKPFFITQYVNTSQKNIIMVRNPKEIIISGYLYHKKCGNNDKWALHKYGLYYNLESIKQLENNNLPPDLKKICLQYFKESTKFSIPIPYQDKLNNLNLIEGIKKEMNSVAYQTIHGMYNLKNIDNENVFILKFEDLIYNHDNTIKKLCQFLNIKNSITENIIKKSLNHNLIHLKNNNKILRHSTNKSVKKNRYLDYWNNELEEEFNKLFPKDVMKKFGYE